MILDLTEKEFFSLDQSFVIEREALLVDTSFSGIAVNAPKQIFTTRHDSLPLAIAVGYSGERGWKIPLQDNTILFGMNLESGKVNFAKAFVSERDVTTGWGETKKPRGTKPSGLAIRSASLKLVDVRQKLNIDWMDGRWALGAIYYDWPSNIVTLDIEGEKRVNAYPPLSVNPAPDPRGAPFLPGYQQTAEIQQPPKSGLIFTADFKVVDGEPQLHVVGSFALPIHDFHLSNQKMEHHFQDGSDKKVAALIPMTFAVIGLDWDEPIQFDWVVPVYAENFTAGKLLGTGNFSIDALAADLSMELPAGEFVCYILTDGKLFGPNSLQVPGGS